MAMTLSLCPIVSSTVPPYRCVHNTRETASLSQDPRAAHVAPTMTPSAADAAEEFDFGFTAAGEVSTGGDMGKPHPHLTSGLSHD